FGPVGGHSWASSLTSSDDDEKFELIADDLTPVTVFRCDPSIEESACPARPAADLAQWLAPYSRPPTTADACRGQGQTGRAGGLRLDPVVPHPLSDSHRAWLLRPGTAGGESAVPSPMVQWQAAMASDSLFRPGSTTPSTSAPAAAVTSENRGWLLRPAADGVGQSPPPADALSQCTERAARLSLEETRSPWLAQTTRLSLEETRSPWLLGGGARSPGGPFPAMEEEEGVMEPGAVPDLLAPFKQMENNTAWVAARG
ncbi:uncharacterized protein LOC122367069, partial [Amphibalanus amphitrite]|uniref:uncharacterized protein LOC122367069 n=1 Tax=Amphibalanus amphitrite TaxID=1232801 RepID=UPI001C901160